METESISEDIRHVLQLLNEDYKEEGLFEDKHMKIYSKGGTAYKIELKPKGKAVLDKILGKFEDKKLKGNTITFEGVQIHKVN